MFHHVLCHSIIFIYLDKHCHNKGEIIVTSCLLARARINLDILRGLFQELLLKNVINRNTEKEEPVKFPGRGLYLSAACCRKAPGSQVRQTFGATS